MNTKISQTIHSLMDIKGIGASFIKKKLPILLTLTEESKLKDNILEVLESEKKGFDTSNLDNIIEETERVFNYCREQNISIISITDNHYPSVLYLASNPPPILFCKGNLACLKQNVMSIIGARKSDSVGNKIAQRIASYYNSIGYSICNGLADGIDTNSLNINGIFLKNAIGIIGGGIDFLNQNTINKVSKSNAIKVLENDGLIISTQKVHKKETTFSIIDSCKIQASLAQGLILIQATETGGSRFTLKTSVELSKPLGIVSYSNNMDSVLFGANKILLGKNNKDIASWLEIKENVISSNMILPIESSLDYDEFHSLIQKSRQDLTLF